MPPRGMLVALAWLTLVWAASACDPERPPVCVPVSDATAVSADTRAAFPHHTRLAERLTEATDALASHPDAPWDAVAALETWVATLTPADRRLPDALRTVEASPAVLDDPRFQAELQPWLAETQLRLDTHLRHLAGQDPDAARAAANALAAWLDRN